MTLSLMLSVSAEVVELLTANKRVPNGGRRYCSKEKESHSQTTRTHGCTGPRLLRILAEKKNNGDGRSFDLEDATIQTLPAICGAAVGAEETIA